MSTAVFKNNFKMARELAGLTMEQAASIAGVTKGAVSSYESGRMSPTVNVLKKLARAYNADISYLIGINYKGKFILVNTSEGDLLINYDMIVSVREDFANGNLTISMSDDDLITATMTMDEFIKATGGLRNG